jgi:hypothetical protein
MREHSFPDRKTLLYQTAPLPVLQIKLGLQVLGTSRRDYGFLTDTCADDNYERIVNWISPLNFFQRQADVFSSWQPGTGSWLLAHPQFRDWKCSPGSVLWCYGIRENLFELLHFLLIAQPQLGQGKQFWCMCLNFDNSDI